MASFTSSVTPNGPYSATLYASFTGGSSTYGYSRAINIYLNGISYSFAVSAESSGSDSTFVDTLEGLDPDTTYSYSCELLSWSSSGWISTGWTTSGSFHTPSALTLTLTPTASSISATLSGFEDVNYVREIQWTLVQTDTSQTVATYTTYVAAHATSTSQSFTSLFADKAYQCTCVIYRYTDHQYLATITGSARTLQGATVYIYSNSAWHAATPYIYSNGAWHEAQPNIYSSGWH